MKQRDEARNSAAEMIIKGLDRPVLPLGLRLPLIITAIFCAFPTLLLGIHYAGTSQASPLDNQIQAFADGIYDSVPFGLMIDAAGEPRGAITLIAVICTVCIALRRWRLALLTVASQAVVGSLTNFVKPLFDRTIHGPHLSYPSGHTAGATAFALVIGLLIVSLVQWRPSIALAVVLGLSATSGAVAAWAQTMLVGHYATDTIGGFCFALTLVVPVALLIDAAIGWLPGINPEHRSARSTVQ